MRKAAPMKGANAKVTTLRTGTMSGKKASGKAQKKVTR